MKILQNAHVTSFRNCQDLKPKCKLKKKSLSWLLIKTLTWPGLSQLTSHNIPFVMAVWQERQEFLKMAAILTVII
jgi:hypothetical protein